MNIFLNQGRILSNFVESEEEAKSTGIEPVFRKLGCIGERARGGLRAVKFIREDLRRATGFGRTSCFGENNVVPVIVAI